MNQGDKYYKFCLQDTMVEVAIADPLTDGTIYGKEISSYRIDGRTNHNSTWVTLADRVRYSINI